MSSAGSMRYRIMPGTLGLVRAVAACALLLLGMVTFAARHAYASSGFGIERYSVSAIEEGGAVDTQAGSHPSELVIEAALDQSGSNSGTHEVENLDFELPPGLILHLTGGSPNTVVGEMEMRISGTSMSAPVRELAPSLGELAQLGFTLDGYPMRIGIAIRAGRNYGPNTGGYGLTMGMDGISLPGVEALKLTLGPDREHLMLPTSCAGSLQSTIQGESRGGETASLSSSLVQLTGCSTLTFEPALNVAPDLQGAYEPSGYTLRLNVPQHQFPSEPATSQLEGVSVSFPAGVSLSLSATNGLTGCTEAQFAQSPTALRPAEGESCPESSKLGVIKIRTPMLANPLEGALFLATPDANPFGTLVALYVVAEDPASGTTIKLGGQLRLNPATGQVDMIFAGLPQLPIDEIELHLFGGQRSLLVNPPTCGPANSSADFDPWSGDAQAAVSSSFNVTLGLNGRPCVNPAPFHPQLRFEPATVRAGSSGTLVLSVSRQPGEQSLARFTVRLPTGLSWMLGEVSSCGEPSATQGSCPVASRIGMSIIRVGPDPELASFSGPVYLTGGYGGARYGLSVALDARAGPFDLGKLVLRTAVAPDPVTGALAINSDPLPQLLDGIPLQTDSLELKIERPGFILNPTVCESRQIADTIESSQGASVQSSIPFTVEGCQSSVPPPAPAGAHRASAKPHSSQAISHVHGRLSGHHLLLRFTTSASGTVTVTGRGVHTYVKRLRSGVHRVRLSLSRFGLRELRRHRRFKVRLTLRVAGVSLSVATWTVKP